MHVVKDWKSIFSSYYLVCFRELSLKHLKGIYRRKKIVPYRLFIFFCSETNLRLMKYFAALY